MSESTAAASQAAGAEASVADPHAEQETGTPLLLVVAATLFFFLSTWTRREFIVLAPAVALLVFSAYELWRGRVRRKHPVFPLILALGLLLYDLAFPRVLQHPDGTYPVHTWHLVHTAIWLVVGLVLLAILWSRGRRPGRWLLWLLLGLTFSSGASLILLTPDPPIDVWQLHQQAGEALLDGANPYSDIRVVSTFRPDEDSAVMTGYAYPPLSLVTNGLVGAVTGDARWASLAAWLAVLALVWRRGASTPGHAALLFLLASQPAWYLVLEASYSEPITIALLVAGLFHLRGNVGAVLLGLGLGSKQYLAILLPLIILAPLLTVRRRVVASVTTVASLGAGIIWGVSEYVDAAFRFHLRVPPQSHSSNLYGLLSEIGIGPAPPVVVLAVVVVASVILGPGAHTETRLGVAAATVLSLAFLLAPQAFANYWLLIGVLVLASVTPPTPTTTVVRAERSGTFPDRSDSGGRGT